MTILIEFNNPEMNQAHAYKFFINNLPLINLYIILKKSLI